jgi:hypothetical protein
VFTARYGLIPYIRQITFRSLKVNVVYRYNTNSTNVLSTADNFYTCWAHLVYHTNFHPFRDTLNSRLNCKYINLKWTTINTPDHTQKMTVISGLPQSSGWLITDCIQQLDRYTMIRPHAGADSPLGTCKGRSTPPATGKPQPEWHFLCRHQRLFLSSIISL